MLARCMNFIRKIGLLISSSYLVLALRKISKSLIAKTNHKSFVVYLLATYFCPIEVQILMHTPISSPIQNTHSLGTSTHTFISGLEVFPTKTKHEKLGHFLELCSFFVTTMIFFVTLTPLFVYSTLSYLILTK